jgi:hypothetical protein
MSADLDETLRNLQVGDDRSVTRTGQTVTGFEVEHDSVRSGGVVKTTFTEGLFYR